MPDPTRTARLLADARQLADQLVDDATSAADTVRTMIRSTLTRPPIPAPELCRILDPLEQLAIELDQLLRQLGGSLTNAADVFDLVDDDPDTDPAIVVRLAADSLDDAATHAYRGALELADARNLISGQHHLTPDQHTPTEHGPLAEVTR